MIDCKNFTPKTVLQLCKSNPKFNKLITQGSAWVNVQTHLSTKLKLNQEQLAEIKNYYTKKTK